MPRKKREESPTGVYHWIVRGMNRKDLFHDENRRCQAPKEGTGKLVK